MKKQAISDELIGLWHIYTMEAWGEDYFNMEVQAFIELNPNGCGEFQFGLVSGDLNGYLEKVSDQTRFVFTWEGQDEMDEASGSGWIKLGKNQELEGFIRFHSGDDSHFNARRAN
ncbi:MAG: hypothetical protein VKL42_01150 [Snowella sp.]|nr:hypothetical protein [Snowella sp.]